VALPDVRLDADDMLHLFDRFYQPLPLGSERASYLGLSLAIAQLIAGWHGGKAYAETTPDGNLTLCYELPLGS
jgi:signal transduction histidine kinase